MCLLILAIYHPGHASTQSLMSRFIRGQQYLSVISFCVAPLPGWHRPCCSSKIRLVALLGMMGCSLPWRMSHQNSVSPNFLFCRMSELGEFSSSFIGADLSWSVFSSSGEMYVATSMLDRVSAEWFCSAVIYLMSVTNSKM